MDVFTEREIELVRKTWAVAGSDADAVAALFYGRLFDVAPGVRPLFPDDMKVQGQKLMQMISVAVNNMEKVEQIIPVLGALGRRHVDYGALPEHYPVVGEVLIETLATALGADFSDEAEIAWTRTYAILRSVMLDD